MWEFEIGASVVCINDQAPDGVLGNFKAGALRLGEVYTVADVGQCKAWNPWHHRPDTLVLRLQSVPNFSKLKHAHDLGWAASRFRPLESYGDLHSLFQPIKQPEEVGA